MFQLQLESKSIFIHISINTHNRTIHVYLFLKVNLILDLDLWFLMTCINLSLQIMSPVNYLTHTNKTANNNHFCHFFYQNIFNKNITDYPINLNGIHTQRQTRQTFCVTNFQFQGWWPVCSSIGYLSATQTQNNRTMEIFRKCSTCSCRLKFITLIRNHIRAWDIWQQNCEPCSESSSFSNLWQKNNGPIKISHSVQMWTLHSIAVLLAMSKY